MAAVLCVKRATVVEILDCAGNVKVNCHVIYAHYTNVYRQFSKPTSMYYALIQVIKR